MLVNIKETLEKVVEVESLKEAQDKYSSGEIELDAEDLKCVEIAEYHA